MHGNVYAAQISDQGRLLGNDRRAEEQAAQRAQGYKLEDRQFLAQRSN